MNALEAVFESCLLGDRYPMEYDFTDNATPSDTVCAGYRLVWGTTEDEFVEAMLMRRGRPVGFITADDEVTYAKFDEAIQMAIMHLYEQLCEDAKERADDLREHELRDEGRSQ